MLKDFGVAVRLSPGSGAVDTVAIVENPTDVVDQVATEIGVRVPSRTALVRTSVLSGFKIEDAVEVLEGPYAGSFVAYDVEALDDGAFTLIDLGRP